jgi:hypothetical protein
MLVKSRKAPQDASRGWLGELGEPSGSCPKGCLGWGGDIGAPISRGAFAASPLSLTMQNSGMPQFPPRCSLGTGSLAVFFSLVLFPFFSDSSALYRELMPLAKVKESHDSNSSQQAGFPGPWRIPA